ncbi:type VI secretion system Vgr family protein [Sorangium sp. So ce131]|uniref:type VI secretion system Vgr family protein n=1 Tax=Sorangium sp. So ce131 TaxID=3133282 RepID=UPI003F63103C
MALNVTLDFLHRERPSPIAALFVHRYHLRDGLSELFELTLQIVSTDPAIDMHTLIGETVIVHFEDEPVVSQIQGMVRGVRQLSTGSTATSTQGSSIYEVDVVPPLWLTTRRRDHRIFVNQDTPGIVQEILDGYDLRIPAPTVSLRVPSPKREYVVQYGETDYDFISRILAADGITSFFDHASQSTWTLLDDTAILTAQPVAPTPFIPPSHLTLPPPHVFNVAVSSNIETSATHVRDYNFANVDASLDADGEPRRSGSGRSSVDRPYLNEPRLEAYFFEVGKFTTESAGKQRASGLLEALRARGRSYTMEANFTQGPGTQIEITNHPRDDANGRFVVVRVRVIVDDAAANTGDSITNIHVLECVPASVPFRPVPGPKPRIHSNQTAFVVGGDDGEIVSDSMGRVRVQFKWDREDVGCTTRMVRVSQAWAGGGYGFFALPRVGDEVIIAYLDGDPDEPLIVGRVHNNKRPVPVNPTGNTRTVSTWRSQSLKDPQGFNEVLMDDATGKERLELHAQRDFRSVVEHDSTAVVKNDDKRSVEHDRFDKVKQVYTIHAGSLNIACGPYQLSTSKIKASATGTIHLEADEPLTAKAPAIELDGGSSIVLKSGQVIIDTDAIVLQAGASSIEIGASGVTIKGPQVTIEGSGVVDIDGGLITLN